MDMKIQKQPSIVSIDQQKDTKAAEKAKKNVVQNTSDVKQSSTANGKGHFNVKFSKPSQELNAAYQKAYEIAQNTPEVREQRVAELKAKIEKGEYKVDSEAVADGLLREAICDHLTNG